MGADKETDTDQTTDSMRKLDVSSEKKMAGMESLINMVNKLQDAFTKVGITNPIDLPQIVVVGSQSSGKSSVLENLVGKDFLPRGSGIVTRRPLVLQLVHRPGQKDEEWGEFLHRQGEKFTDFHEIRQEIVRDTELKAGKTKTVSPIPIHLRVYSPSVVTLTLVDLPGLTKVPVADQPKDIERQIRDMNLKYISNKNAIILAVTAANTDLANSDSLKIAREVDPEGFRTIGVLTKIDLMDRGTDVLDILSGKIIPLQLGYIPIVNRGQKDIETNTQISAALERENSFFDSHPAYKAKAKFCGTGYLARRLSAALMKHIRKNIPDIKAKIAALLERNKKELEGLGQETFGQSHSIFLSVIGEFSTDFRQILEGNLQDISKNELSGGARISYIFHEIFSKAVLSIDPLESIKEQDIRTLIYNSSGSTPALFVSTQSFEVLVKQLVVTLEEPSLKCIALVHDELSKILHQLLSKTQFRRFPLLKEKTHHEVQALYKRWAGPTRALVSDIVSSECAYVNTGHSDFVGGQKAMSEAYARMGQKDKKPAPAQKSVFNTFTSQTKNTKSGVIEAPPSVLRPTTASTERELVEIEVIKILIESYFNIVKKTIADLVPKAIMLKMVGRAKEEIQQELLKAMYKMDTLESLLAESEEVVERRKECSRMVKALLEADEIISAI
ncbi:MAG: vacuolar protein sorting-associated protein 1 [Amphiamblys sp. WSBS2006]|nr:MAG: vacuolar protein sorting-associated protein 1 [Amphiamblys sp. WSBS2006]